MEEPTPGPHLPEEVGSSREVRQYIGLRGGARLFPLMCAGRPRDNNLCYKETAFITENHVLKNGFKKENFFET